ncbi:hypothetical protein AMTRI_Chr13g121380 [Amborella trichopoda]
MDEILHFFKETTYLFFCFDLIHLFIRRNHGFVEGTKWKIRDRINK